ncbi:MAG: hypothetical protein V8S72_08590 [Oscillospiraceae bacterium]
MNHDLDDASAPESSPRATSPRSSANASVAQQRAHKLHRHRRHRDQRRARCDPHVPGYHRRRTGLHRLHVLRGLQKPRRQGRGEQGREYPQQHMGLLFNHPDALPEDYRAIADEEGIERAATDYVSGMTDNYVMDVYSELFIPKSWQVR